MKPQTLWKLSIAATEETEEAVTETLTAKLGQSVTSYTDLATGVVTVSTYLSRKSHLSRATRGELAEALSKIGVFSCASACLKVSVNKIRPQDWTESWKRHFRPIEVGTRLLIKPSWSRRQARPGQMMVVLDPGMSFGTGQHPTTHFCLDELERHRNREKEQSFLDIGTGSGILAISAVKLGYHPVIAFDLDPEAVAIAQANARRNRVPHLIQFSCRDVTRMALRPAKRYSLICANLLANLLLEHRNRILASLGNHGILALAGILETEFAEVQASYEAAGLHLVRSRVENEWRSASFAFGPRDRNAD